MTKKRPIKTRTKEQMKEISDIVRNAETDEAALAFLKETLEDDFPELDLGKMDLHEASEILMGAESTEKASTKELSQDLNAVFGSYMRKSNENKDKKNTGRKRRKRSRRKRKRK